MGSLNRKQPQFDWQRQPPTNCLPHHTTCLSRHQLDCLLPFPSCEMPPQSRYLYFLDVAVTGPRKLLAQHTSYSAGTTCQLCTLLWSEIAFATDFLSCQGGKEGCVQGGQCWAWGPWLPGPRSRGKSVKTK